VGRNSTLSAPTSRRDQSYSNDSASSRPSAFSAAQMSNSDRSTTISHSVASQSPTRKRGEITSLTLSEFGRPQSTPLPMPSPPPTAHFGGDRNSGTVSPLAVDTLVTTTATEPRQSPTTPTSPALIQFSPWAAGLDPSWHPTET
jgi:hypothetical protein